MTESRSRRVLVLTDHVEPTPGLMDALSRRGGEGDVQFRLVVLNPASAEIHLLHPERHDKAAEAEQVLRKARPAIEGRARGPVIGSVSVRHDAMAAIEETLFSEPIDEIMLAMTPHIISQLLHQDLQHR